MSAKVAVENIKGTSFEWKTFDSLGENLAFGKLREYWLDEICALIYSRIGLDCASKETIGAMIRQNSDVFWGVFERSGDTHKLIACHGQLMLNRLGHDALKARTFAFKTPDPFLLCNEGERPEAVYLWATVAERKLAQFKPMLARALNHYAGLPHYATCATEAGLKVSRVIGLRPLTPEDNRIGGLFIFKTGTSHQESFQPSRVNIVTVKNPEQFDQVRAIRAVVFMGEQACPYAEEFDGNDFCATHVLGYVNGEPAGTARIRYFQDFAKIERVAVIERFRGTGLVHKIADYVEEIVRRKGYAVLYGHPQKRLLGFWTKRGFEQINRNSPFHFSDHEYAEIQKHLDPHPDRLSLHSEPMVLIRPEGSWDEAGILEKSAERPPTNPH